MFDLLRNLRMKQLMLLLYTAGYLWYNWTDPHLTWKPSDYDEVDDLHVPSDELWVPDITVHNAGDLSSAKVIPKTLCGLNYDGGITCVPAAKFTAYCNTDYTNYPFDVQNCSIDFSSWSYSTDEVRVHMSNKSIILSGYVPNKEWIYIGSYVTSESQNFKIDSNYSSHVHKLIIVLQRRGAGIHVIYIAPAIVLMVMTLSTLWLDCHSTERMIVGCLSFICHLICIQDLYWSIPHNGDATPKIVQFYENSFLLMACTLVLTVLMRELRALTSPAPQWITLGTSYILQSKVGQLLLLSILDPKASAFLEKSADDNADLMHAEQNDSTWSYVTLLIGWVAFISVFFAYMILLALYMPSQETMKEFAYYPVDP